jgi:hypothetical protein
MKKLEVARCFLEAIPRDSSWCTVKNAVELLDVPSRNNSLVMKKYNSHIKILFLYTDVLFFNSVIE